MKCNNIELMISLHIDNKLSLEEVSSLMEHFDSCEKCRQLYKDFKDIKSILLDNNKQPILSDNFTNYTMQKIKNLKSQPKENNIVFVKFVKKHLVMVASFIFIVTASIVFMTQSIDINNSVNSINSSAELDYCVNYEQYTNVEDLYEDDIISFLLVY